MELYGITNQDKLTDIKRRLRRGYGEIIEISWVDLTETVNEESGEMDYAPVEQKGNFYVGKMTLGQTGTIVAVLGALFINGMDLRREFGMNNLAFLNAIDEGNLSVLLGCIIGQPEQWVLDNYDPAWMVAVIARFFKHNDFFGLIQQVMKLLETYGITPEKATALATAQVGARTS